MKPQAGPNTSVEKRIPVQKHIWTSFMIHFQKCYQMLMVLKTIQKKVGLFHYSNHEYSQQDPDTQEEACPPCHEIHRCEINVPMLVDFTRLNC